MFFEITHMDLNVCFDTGHANMNEGVEAAFRLMKTAHPLHAHSRQ